MADSYSKKSNSKLKQFFAGDLWYDFHHSPVALLSFSISVLCLLLALTAQLIAPFDIFDLAAIDLMDADLPPPWAGEEGDSRFFLGTDDQGRDIWSGILYGAQISIFVGFTSVIISAIIGIALGLLAGYKGGRIDSFIMRVADIQLSFPAILIALLIDGVMRGLLPREMHDELAVYVLIFAISISGWVQYARTIRGSVMVEKNKEYVQAGQVIGLPSHIIALRHILPNVLNPIFVIGTIHLASAIITEATLSYLGVGMSPTTPSLGTLIRIGNEYLLSGEWWITLFPGAALVILVLSVNIFGDWLRDALNPKLR
ncbi:MAG: peptide ABC transporter permease [Osedax symbiont Rs1]|nr:MAG: peptide ABC transporter permease [Osedax symbiont Rs1]